MTLSIVGVILGALAGLAVTAVITLLWPRERLRWLRPLLAPGLGVLVAYFLMRII